MRSDDPKREDKIDYAKKHNLHHYHIGIPRYNQAKSGIGLVSEYVLHYQLLSDEDGEFVRIVDYSRHPPFTLPEEERLTKLV